MSDKPPAPPGSPPATPSDPDDPAPFEEPPVGIPVPEAPESPPMRVGDKPPVSLPG